MTAIRGSIYRFDHPRLSDIMHDMFIRPGELAPGDTVPPFALTTTDGGCVSTADLQQGGRPAVVVMVHDGGDVRRWSRPGRTGHPSMVSELTPP